MKKGKSANFLYLLCSLVLLLVLYPFLEGTQGKAFLLSVLFTFVLLSTLYAIRHDRRYLPWALLLGIPALAANWVNFILPQSSSIVASLSFWIFFYAFTTFMLLQHVLRSKEITANQIFGAICVYLLIGFIWGGIFALIDVLQPDAFSMQSVTKHTPVSSDFVYYSFVTLTTTGYGDIVPRTPLARTFATIEAMFGVLYIAVLIARLVGTHIAKAMREA